MKHEQVIPDYIVMLESSITVLALVGCGWLLFKFVVAQSNFLLRGFNLKFSQARVGLHLVSAVHEEPRDRS